MYNKQPMCFLGKKFSSNKKLSRKSFDYQLIYTQIDELFISYFSGQIVYKITNH